MISLRLPELKQAADKLFAKEDFDYFLVREINITTGTSFHIDGRLHKDFYTKEEMAEMRNTVYADWKQLRPVCYQLIKGKKLPLSFQITLSLSPDNIDKFSARYHLSYDSSQITGLYLHFRYENKILTMSTGTSMNVFTMDKSPDRAWDEMARLILKHAGIYHEELT